MATTRRSLRVELIVSLAVILMMAVVSLSLASELLGGRRHLQAQREQLAGHARGLAALVAPMVGGGDPGGEAEAALRPSIGSQGIEAVLVYRAAGGAMQPVVTVGLPPELAAPALAEPSADGDEAEIHETEAGALVVDQPIRTFGPGRPRMVLRLVAHPSPWTRVGDWPELLVLAGGVGGLLLVAGVLLLELQVLRPLARVQEAVEAVARGELETRVPEEGPAELQSLATAFNEMTGALAGRVREIEAQRERLVRAEQLASVGRISAGVAHEVGNPLAAILGYVELLLDPRAEPPLAEEQRALLERSRRQIERIQGIVGQLLDYSRPSRQQVRDVEVGPALEQLLALLEHDPRCTGVELTVEAPPEVHVRADPALLDQVVQNLVVNGARAAREAESEPPRVGLSVRRTEDAVVIEVSDTGAGVPSEVGDRVFDPFYTTARAGQGTGLGLAVSRGLVEGMGGTLRLVARPAEDEGAFAGAVFRVTLPAGAPAGPDRDVARDPPPVE